MGLPLLIWTYRVIVDHCALNLSSLWRALFHTFFSDSLTRGYLQLLEAAATLRSRLFKMFRPIFISTKLRKLHVKLRTGVIGTLCQPWITPAIETHMLTSCQASGVQPFQHDKSCSLFHAKLMEISNIFVISNKSSCCHDVQIYVYLICILNVLVRF